MNAASLERRLRDLFAQEPTVEVGFYAAVPFGGPEVALGAEIPFASASTIKTALAVEIFRRAEAGDIDLDERIELTEEVKTLSSGVLQALQLGLTPTVRDLVVLSTIISDNTATEMLVRKRGGAKALDRALGGLGMGATRYVFGPHEMSLHGFRLPADATLTELKTAAKTCAWELGSPAFSRGDDNTVTTARDMGELLARVARGEVLGHDGTRELWGIMGGQQYTDRIPRHLPWGGVRNKTGTLGGARGDVGLMRRPDGGEAAFAMLTWDPTPLPAGNSDALVERTARVNRLFAEAGRQLWDALGAGASA